MSGSERIEAAIVSSSSYLWTRSIHLKTTFLLMATVMTMTVTGLVMAEEASSGGFQVGILTCSSAPESQKNLIVASSVELDCELKYNNGEVDRYSGKSGVAAGLDLNWKRSELLKYAVLAASQDATPGAGALAGRFVGGKGSVTLGYGGAAGALVGGSDSNLTLQPLALEGSKGLGVAAGVSYLTLEHKPNK
jgi:hypothetical protein